MPDLKELQQRVSEAKGPDRELDARIWWEFDAEKYGIDRSILSIAETANVIAMLDHRLGKSWRTEFKELPQYTASLEAALALVERMGLDTRSILTEALTRTAHWTYHRGSTFLEALVLAVLYIALVALIAKESEHG